MMTYLDRLFVGYIKLANFDGGVRELFLDGLHGLLALLEIATRHDHVSFLPRHVTTEVEPDATVR